jgi:hypothetical protein
LLLIAAFAKTGKKLRARIMCMSVKVAPVLRSSLGIKCGHTRVASALLSPLLSTPHMRIFGIQGVTICLPTIAMRKMSSTQIVDIVPSGSGHVIDDIGADQTSRSSASGSTIDETQPKPDVAAATLMETEDKAEEASTPTTTTPPPVALQQPDDALDEFCNAERRVVSYTDFGGAQPSKEFQAFARARGFKHFSDYGFLPAKRDDTTFAILLEEFGVTKADPKLCVATILAWRDWQIHEYDGLEHVETQFPWERLARCLLAKDEDDLLVRITVPYPGEDWDWDLD